MSVIDDKDIDVSVSGDTLMLKSETRHEKEEKQELSLLRALVRPFQRTFQFPCVDSNQVSDDVSNVVLTITLSKTE